MDSSNKRCDRYISVMATIAATSTGILAIAASSTGMPPQNNPSSTYLYVG